MYNIGLYTFPSFLFSFFKGKQTLAFGNTTIKGSILLSFPYWNILKSNYVCLKNIGKYKNISFIIFNFFYPNTNEYEIGPGLRVLVGEGVSIGPPCKLGFGTKTRDQGWLKPYQRIIKFCQVNKWGKVLSNIKGLIHFMHL